MGEIARVSGAKAGVIFRGIQILQDAVIRWYILHLPGVVVEEKAGCSGPGQGEDLLP
jgi:hypothetical protein